MSSDNITVVGSDTVSQAASTPTPAFCRVSLDLLGLFPHTYKLGLLRKVEYQKKPSLVIVRWYMRLGEALGSRHMKQRVTKVLQLRKGSLNPRRRYSAVASLSKATAVLV